jgi:hypothetical protein
MIFSCSTQTSQFIQLDYSVQASCLCYSSMTWIPNVFDNFWGHCVSLAATLSPSPNITGSGGFCTIVGNILAVTASASTTSGSQNSLSSQSASPSPTMSIAVATISVTPAASTTSKSSSGTARAAYQVRVTLLSRDLMNK